MYITASTFSSLKIAFTDVTKDSSREGPKSIVPFNDTQSGITDFIILIVFSFRLDKSNPCSSIWSQVSIPKLPEPVTTAIFLPLRGGCVEIT